VDRQRHSDPDATCRTNILPCSRNHIVRSHIAGRAVDPQAQKNARRL
jgi:hypothetical protein